MSANAGASRTSSRSGAGRLLAFAALVLAMAAACTPGTWPSPTSTATPPFTNGASPSPTATPALTTGVRGVVLAGPTCPVEHAGQSPCVRAVSGARILALDSAGNEVGRAESDATGAYFLRLPPGTYEIVPQPVEGLMGVAAQTTVTVPDGTPAQLDLRYDTGIR